MPMDAPAAGPAPGPEYDQFTSLSHGERWFLDGFEVMRPPGGLLFQLCDMTQAHAALLALRERGRRATYTHLIVRATALALRRYPQAHQLMCGYTRAQPAHVDIGLSVAGQTCFAPVLVIKGADERPLPELVDHMQTAVPATRAKEERDLVGMRRIGWLIPFGPVRRWLLRLLGRTFWFRRRLVGTFQVSCVPDCDQLVPMFFYSGCMLGVGRVSERVLPVDGHPAVRLSAWLSVPFDHRAMDGRIAGGLLQTVRQILESPELLAEAGAWPAGASADPQEAPPLPALQAPIDEGEVRAATGV
jgi:hypothetical protein